MTNQAVICCGEEYEAVPILAFVFENGDISYQAVVPTRLAKKAEKNCLSLTADFPTGFAKPHVDLWHIGVAPYHGSGPISERPRVPWVFSAIAS